MATPPALPAHAALLRDFANTVDMDTGVDRLTSPAELAGWLREQGLLAPEPDPQPDPAGGTEADLADALGLRAGLRAAMTTHHERPDAPANGGMTGADTTGGDTTGADTTGADTTGADTASPAARFDAVAARLPLRVSFAPGAPRLEPAADGVRGALASLLVAMTASAADGSWARLKICPADNCRWAFYDASKNRSRTWCDMQVCGNREKTRAYRARRRSPA